jgi:hypothetical protein
LNIAVIIVLFTGYVSLCSIKNHVLLLAFLNANFKAERKLQTFFCSQRGMMCPTPQPVTPTARFEMLIWQ